MTKLRIVHDITDQLVTIETLRSLRSMAGSNLESHDRGAHKIV